MSSLGTACVACLAVLSFFVVFYFLLQGNVTSILGRAVPGQVWHVHVDLFLCKKSASQPVRVFVCYMK